MNPIGLIPKPHRPGKWRLIVNLSAPEGHSVNDGISKELASMHYASMDDAVNTIRRLGRGTLLAKLDLKSAYRKIPVHSDDHALLGMRWEGKTYLDCALPFGLRSAPKVFSAVADALSWAMVYEGIEDVLHYLDDFLFFGPPQSPHCQTAMRTALRVCDALDLPVAPEKVDGPSSYILFLGIGIDTKAMELRLPHDKLARLLHSLKGWQTRRACTKRELLSLIGVLQHAATIVRPV